MSLRNKKYKVFDCFLFFNELELLDIRLNILDPVVDTFVILESNLTFTGQPKEYLFEKNVKNFARFLPKIDYFKLGDAYGTVSGLPMRPWVREYVHRNVLYSIFLEISELDDVFICSDLDMIFNPGAFEQFVDLVFQNYYLTFELFDFCYYLNTTWRTMPYFQGSVMGQIRDRKQRKINYGQPNEGFQYIMEVRERFLKIPQAGWHYSFLGDLQQISEKLNAFSHTEINLPEVNNINNIKEKRTQLIPINTSGKTEQMVPIELNEDNCPLYILNNLSKFSHLIYNKNVVS